MCSWELEIVQVLPPAANRVLFSPISQGWLRARPRKRPQQGNAQHRTFYSSSVMVIREVKSTKSASLFVCRGRASFLGCYPAKGAALTLRAGWAQLFPGGSLTRLSTEVPTKLSAVFEGALISLSLTWYSYPNVFLQNFVFWRLLIFFERKIHELWIFQKWGKFSDFFVSVEVHAKFHLHHSYISNKIQR